MKKRYTLYIQVLLLTVMAACATMPSPAGKWQTSLDLPQGAMEIGFNFQVEGNSLTGTTSNQFTGDIPIRDGTVKGNDLQFKVDVQSPGGAMVVVYDGVLENDQIRFTTSFESGAPQGVPANFEMVADRVVE